MNVADAPEPAADLRLSAFICGPLKGVVIVYGKRRVVGKATARVDVALAGERGDAGRGDLVVDAPAHVLRVGLPAVGPEGVALGARVQATEGVDEPVRLEYAREPLTLKVS